MSQTAPDYVPFKQGDEVSFRHQALTHFGYIIDVDPFRKAKGSDRYGAAFIRLTVGRNQTTIWVPFEKLTKVDRRRRPD